MLVHFAVIIGNGNVGGTPRFSENTKLSVRGNTVIIAADEKIKRFALTEGTALFFFDCDGEGRKS